MSVQAHRDDTPSNSLSSDRRRSRGWCRPRG